MMDPFGQQQQQQQQRRQGQQQGQNVGANGSGGQLRPFDPFASMAMSPFDHHRAHNPFSLMHQMMGNMNNVFRHPDPFSNLGGFFELSL